MEPVWIQRCATRSKAFKLNNQHNIYLRIYYEWNNNHKKNNNAVVIFTINRAAARRIQIGVRMCLKIYLLVLERTMNFWVL